MKQPTLADLYFDDEFISTSGVVQGLMSGAKDGDQSYVIDKHNDGTESVYYTTESGTRYFLGVRNPEDIQLAAGPSPVVSDAGAAFGVYPGMGKRTQKSDTGEKMILGLPDLAAGGVKGLISGSVGGTGDILAIGRGLYEIGRRGGDQSVLDAFLHGMEQGFILPTSNDVDKWLTKQFGPVVPAGTSAFGLTPEERQTAATVGRITGEIVANPFTVLKAAPMVGKGIAKGAEYLGPKAAELAQQGIEKTMAPMMPRIVEQGPSMGDAAKAAAPVSDIGFYSAVEKAASGLQRKSGTGQSFLNDISKGENVKADEIKWMGLDDFLRDKKNVTKQEVQDYIAQNRVDVQEVQLGGAQPYDKNRLAQLESEYKTLEQHPVDDPAFGEEKYDEMIRLMNIRDQSTTQSLYDAAEQATRSAQRAQRQGNKTTAEKYFREAEFLNTRAEKLDLQGQGMSNPPKFGEYTLPGGENYREILLTLPLKQEKGFMTPNGAFFSEADLADPIVRKTAEKIGLSPAFRNVGEKYKSSHWEQPNVLAHIRVNDRVDADGKKMLLIEEVQSDWHQAGREKGYIPKDPMEQRPIDAVPDAPMKDTWYQLALKRAMKYAADNGYDRVGLTTGARQAERYKLSNEVDEINVTGRTDARTGEKTRSVALDLKSGTSYRLGVNNDGVIDNVNMSEIDNFKGKKLSEVVGKDIAKQIMEGSSQTIKGEGLNIGGEGMKKYYDEIYPKFLDKYGKKWGAKVGETSIETQKPTIERSGTAAWKVSGKTEPIRYIDITPEMRASTSKGQPLFTATGVGAGTAGATMDDRKQQGRGAE
jgi:hypothetical protein